MRVSVAGWSRRSFLKLLSSALLAGLSSACGSGGGAWKEAAERMIRTLEHPDRARLLGSLYIEAGSGTRELTAEQWTGELLTALGFDPENIPPDGLDALAKRLRARVREDFVNEDIVIVKGFMFSGTEMMLCALAATYSA